MPVQPTIYDFFRNITAAQNDGTTIGNVEADHTRDTFTIKEGDNISLTVDPANDAITIVGDATQLFVPVGTTTLRHQQGLDIHDVELVGGDGINITRNDESTLTFDIANEFYYTFSFEDTNAVSLGDIVADTFGDTMTWVQGDNITLSVDSATDTVTIIGDPTDLAVPVGTTTLRHTQGADIHEVTLTGGDNITINHTSPTELEFVGDDTDLFVPAGTTTLRHTQGTDIHDIKLIEGYGVGITRNNDGNIVIQNDDGDTNIIWVSKTQGNDNNDGINAPVATIKKACQIASTIAYAPSTTPTASKSGAETLVEENLQFIKDEVVQYVDDTYNGLNYNSDKCARDTGYIAEAAIYDLLFGGNSASRLSTQLYFEGGASEVINNQLTETIAANTFLRDLLGDILAQTTVTPLQTSSTQVTDTNITVDTADIAAVEASVQILIDALTAGNTNSLPALVKPTPKLTPTTIKIASGDYTEANPIIVPDGVSLVGDSLRTVIIRPLNANKNMFSLRNGSYVTQITFRDHLDANGVPDYTWNFTFGFDDILDTDYDRGSYKYLNSFKPVVTTSPYIFNASLISFLGGSGVDVNGDLVQEPNQPAQALELELATDTTPGLPKQGKSMIGAAYTMLTFGGTGWLVRNQAYSQLVSCFQIFAKNGVYTQNGGYVSITNSATNFGLFALRSIGQMPVAFEFDKPIIHNNGVFEGKQSFKVIGSNRRATEHFIIRIRNALDVDITNNHRQTGTQFTFDSSTAISGNLITLPAHGFVGGEKIVYRSNGNKDIVGLLDRNEYYVFVANTNQIGLYEDPNSEFRAVPITTTASQTHILETPDEEFFVDEVIEAHNVYQRLILSAGSYNFTPGSSITGDDSGIPLAAIVKSWDNSTNTLIISNEKVQIGDTAVRNLFSLTSTITQDQTSGTPVTNISLTNVSNLTEFYTTEFTIGSTYTNSNFQNIAAVTGLTMNLHRPSIVNSSAHTWEYAGSGIDYNALPENGGQTITDFQQYRNQEGRVYTSGTNELGDFLVGDFITAENKTGNIQFKNKVTITELDSLSLTLSDVTINEISDDEGLGDNDLNGPLHSRLVTQLAVRSFLDNRLGDFIDKSVSTNAVPSAIAQLNSAGQLNPELIPATRSFASYVVNEYEGRLRISEDIPAGDSQSGDIAIENYEEDVLTLSGTVTVVKGETVTQLNSGATGEVKQNYTSSTSLKLVNVNGTFTTNVADTLTGSTSGALSVYPTVVDAGTEQQDSYFLNRDTSSQFLILEPGSYSFTVGNTVSGAVAQADGEITAYTTGVIVVVNNVGLNGGGGYNTDGTYTNVSLTGGSGTGVTADIVVSSGAVSSVDIKRGGSGYANGNTLSAADGDIGGRTGGTAFSIAVTEVEQRLFIDLGASGIKFSASGANPDFIRDNNSSDKTLSQTFTATNSFDATNDVDYNPNRITITGHGYTNGDPVKYTSGVNLPIGNLANNSVLRVKVIDANTIELYDDYDLTTQRLFTSSSTGTHTLTINGVQTVGSTFYLANHGLSTGDAIQYTGTVTPTGISSGEFFFVGSVTTNSFTLHPSRENALTSVNGITFAKQTVTATGSGNATLQIHDIQVNTQINTSSKLRDNWSVLSSGNIDASNIISGIIDSTRLGTGTANSNTALFGDSQYKLVVTDITNNTADDPITLAGTFTTDGQGNEHYYGNVDIRIENAGADTAVTADANQAYYSKGAAKFLKEHFINSTAGEIQVKPSTQGGTIDAATLGGVARSHYENPENLSRAVPITLGGTNLESYTRGDILFAGNGRDADGLLDDDLDVLSKLSIGTARQVLQVNSAGEEPEWTSELSLTGGTFGNIQVAVTTDNTIDTTTGNLVLDSNGGTVQVNDNLNVDGNIDITGNLTVQGTTTTVDSVTTQVVDPIFQIGGGAGGAALTADDNKDRGVSFKWYDTTEKTGFFGFDDSTGKFTFIPDATIASEVVSGTIGEITASVDWANILNKPDPTITLGGDLTGSVTLTNVGNGTLNATIAANSVALGTDTTGAYVADVTGGTYISTSETAAGAENNTVTINHDATTRTDTTSTAAPGSAGTFTAVDSITSNATGHITAANVKTVTMPTVNNSTITIAAGTGLSTGGDFTTNQATNETITLTNSDRGSSQNIFKTFTAQQSNGTSRGSIVADSNSDTMIIRENGAITLGVNATNDILTIAHADTSSQANVNNSGNTFVQDLTFDTYGHVTGVTSSTVSIGNATITLAAGNGLTAGGDFTTNQSSNETITFNVGAGDGLTVAADTISHADTSTQSSVNNSNGNVIQDVSVDGFGHVTGLTSVNLDGRYFTETESNTKFLIKNANDTGTGGYSSTGSYWEIGRGTGSVAMTANDGNGNANLTFNHRSGVPDQNGSAGRIECGVDGTTGAMYFEVGNSVTAGVAQGLTSVLRLRTTDITAYKNLLTSGNYNIGSSSQKWNTVYATTFDGTATKAKYADLAEKYLADEDYEVGTVIMAGGEAEVTAATEDKAHSVIGVISEAPAFLMNKDLEGGTAIALKGRVKVRVQGNVKKGDRLCASDVPGIAYANNSKDAWSFAVALENGKDFVEAVIL